MVQVYVGGFFSSEETQAALTSVRDFRNVLTVFGFYFPKLTLGCSVMGIEYLVDV